MKTTVASVSDDGMTLHEYDFTLSRLDDKDIVFRLVGVRRWRRSNPDELTPWGEVDGIWKKIDVFHTNTIRDVPEVPAAVMADARQFILQSIQFEIP